MLETSTLIVTLVAFLTGSAISGTTGSGLWSFVTLSSSNKLVDSTLLSFTFVLSFSSSEESSSCSTVVLTLEFSDVSSNALCQKEKK